jgi:hypothetical protein
MKENTIEQNQILLKEYEYCWDHVKHLDTNIWTTSGLIGISSIVSFFTIDLGIQNSFTFFIIGLLIISIVWIWWKISNRWWDIQYTIILRMRDIENELGMFQNRYVRFLDNPIAKRKTIELDGLSEKYLDELKTMSPKFYKGQVRGITRRLPIIITLLWMIYLLKLIIKDFIGGNMQVIGTISITWVGIVIVLGSVLIGGIGIGIMIGMLFKRSSEMKDKQKPTSEK